MIYLVNADNVVSVQEDSLRQRFLQGSHSYTEY